MKVKHREISDTLDFKGWTHGEKYFYCHMTSCQNPQSKKEVKPSVVQTFFNLLRHLPGVTP